MKTIIALGYLAWLLAASTLPAHAEAWPEPTIGGGFGVAAKPERTGYDQMKKIKEAGFTYVRFDMRWSEVEYRHGVYMWSAFDRFIDQLRKFHLKAVIILDGSNGLYTDMVDVPPELAFGESRVHAAPASAEATKAYAAFAAAAVKRYGTNDIIWELWNEPDMLAFWPPQPNPDDFAAFATTVCRAIRDVSPKATIIGPALARFPKRTDVFHGSFFKTFIKSDVKDCLNAISVHPYRDEKTPETVIDDYNDRLRPFIKAYMPDGKTVPPVANSEWGYPLTAVPPELQGPFALRIRLSDMLAHVPLTILYEWQDSADIPDDREQHFGLVNAEGDNNTSGEFIARLLPKIKDDIFIRRIPVNDNDAYVALLREPNGAYKLLAWMGLRQMEGTRKLQIQNIHDNRPGFYNLSLEPQIFRIDSPDASVAVIKG